MKKNEATARKITNKKNFAKRRWMAPATVLSLKKVKQLTWCE